VIPLAIYAPLLAGALVAVWRRPALALYAFAAGNNKTRAADILGISIKTLHNKLNRYNAEAAGS
jgi:DNA-binding protein Fis